MTTPESANPTTGYRDLEIVTCDDGYLKIEAKGMGQPLKLSNERFTNKREAQIALDRYLRDNAKKIEQRQFMNSRPKKVKDNGEGSNR